MLIKIEFSPLVSTLSLQMGDMISDNLPRQPLCRKDMQASEISQCLQDIVGIPNFYKRNNFFMWYLKFNNHYLLYTDVIELHDLVNESEACKISFSLF